MSPRRVLSYAKPSTYKAAAALLFAICCARSHGAGLLIAQGGLGGVLEIVEHTVDVTINNGIAVTEVNQIFQNTENRQVEALYTFPVPKGASVSNFSMWINGKEMIGEVVEKERAREIYNSYKRVRRDPGLLEQKDYKTFEMRIFPVGPRARQRVQITYYQELEFDHDWCTYVYPLATQSRPKMDAKVRGKFALNLDAKSAIPIKAMNSPSHTDDFEIVSHNERYQQASLELDKGELNRDLVIAYHLSRPKTGIDLIASRQSGEDGFFLMTVTAGEGLAMLDAPSDYVFILDISGSMKDDGKFKISTQSISAFIRSLEPKDRFEVITFNITPRPLFKKLVDANIENHGRAQKFLDSRVARGGTVLHPAVREAYRHSQSGRQLNVVILSDGMTEQKERARLLQLIQDRPANTRVFCIGVGNEVNRPLLQQVAEDAGGLAAFISRGDDFERKAKAFRRKLLRPVASDIEIAFSGSEVYDLVPPKLPNLYHGMPVRLMGRYKQSGPVKVDMRTVISGKPMQKTIELDFPERDESNPEIERMWAWHQVDALLKSADRTGSRERVIDEVVRLGEGFSIVTEYTSFLVLENDAEYRRWKIDRRNALRIQRDRRAQSELKTRLAKIRSRAAADVGPLAAVPQPSVTPRIPPANRPTASQPQTRPASPVKQKPRRSFDFDFGGGGAFDPISGAIALGLAGLAFAARRKKEKEG